MAAVESTSLVSWPALVAWVRASFDGVVEHGPDALRFVHRDEHATERMGVRRHVAASGATWIGVEISLGAADRMPAPAALAANAELGVASLSIGGRALVLAAKLPLAGLTSSTVREVILELARLARALRPQLATAPTDAAVISYGYFAE